MTNEIAGNGNVFFLLVLIHFNYKHSFIKGDSDIYNRHLLLANCLIDCFNHMIKKHKKEPKKNQTFTMTYH